LPFWHNINKHNNSATRTEIKEETFKHIYFWKKKKTKNHLTPVILQELVSGKKKGMGGHSFFSSQCAEFTSEVY